MSRIETLQAQLAKEKAESTRLRMIVRNVVRQRDAAEVRVVDLTQENYELGCRLRLATKEVQRALEIAARIDILESIDAYALPLAQQFERRAYA